MAEQILSYKFRVYPTAAQRRRLEHQLAECCRLYNAALAERRMAWKLCRKNVSFYQQSRQLAEIRAAGDTGIASFKIAEEVLRRVDKAFMAFFRRKGRCGFPRFRSASRYDSFGTSTYRKAIGLTRGKLSVFGVGDIKIRMHRPIEGDIRTAVVKREGPKWFCVFTVIVAPKVLPASDSQVGIDVGLNSFAAGSNGETVEAPRILRQAERALRTAQRHVARCVRGSHRRKSAVTAVRQIHTRVRNRRSDFAHKLSRRTVNAHGLIAVERLNITGLARTLLSKSIHDAGWRLFLNQLAYKAANAGREFVEVDAAGTSQACVCGASVPKTLSVRWHDCPACGLSADRDVVSARVILSRGLRERARTEHLGSVVRRAHGQGAHSTMTYPELPGR